VFPTARLAMFGGISSLNEVTPTIFSRSWEWDGRHWTARQDMGPGPRVFHAMAFDAPRSRVVLFGGSPVAIDAEGAQASLRGDTWEQFESGPPAAQFANLVVVPNPVPAGGTLTVTVTLTSPVPTDDQIVILLDNQEVFAIQMPAGSTEGTAQLFIDPTVPAGSTIVVTVRLGTAEASMPVTIAPAAEVQVVSLEAVPNPVAPGNTVTLIVTIAAAAPMEVSVSIETDGQVVAAIPIAAEATTGSLEIPIQPDTPPVTVTLTARSGASQASVDLVIQ
jgi:acyl dehydratase